jgi:hypothetical protein
MKVPRYILHRLAAFGDFIVYQRGRWAQRERIPKFLVSRESDGRDLEEFKRKKDAVQWAQEQDTRFFVERHRAFERERAAQEQAGEGAA